MKTTLILAILITLSGCGVTSPLYDSAKHKRNYLIQSYSNGTMSMSQLKACMLDESDIRRFGK